MSSRTWTPRAVASSAAPFQGVLWRAVEAQHVVSTRALVDTLAEQHVLERLLEEGKPPVPGGAARLHYLLFTPFRYAPPPGGSRFRAPCDAGVSGIVNVKPSTNLACSPFHSHCESARSSSSAPISVVKSRRAASDNFDRARQ